MRRRGPALYQPVSGWDYEVQRFRGLLDRWLDYLLNNFFDLSIRGPGVRRYWTLVLAAAFVAGGFALHTILYFFPILVAPQPFDLPSLPLFFVLTVARLVIILYIPMFIAITLAGNYLADVFELRDPSVAWDFIRDLALGGASQVLHIRDGKVSEESLDSPVLQIGGPGIVIAEFDSAALFEKPDGTPHVIGLAEVISDTGSRPNIILDGFERLREPIINLRDQYLGSPGAEPMTVVSRSLDGIPVSAIDVRGMFSVRRLKSDASTPRLNTPFPFDANDIEHLIYKQAVPVLTEGPFPSGQPGAWATAMQALIRGSFGEFMSQHNLSEYLAGIGSLESDLSDFREDTIVSTTLRYSNDLPDPTGQQGAAPKFHPRSELIDRFTRTADGFSQRARERGLELHWIGVGTWKMPDEFSDELVKGQHLEAWRLNRDNSERASEQTLESVASEAYTNEKIRLIGNVPLAAHQKNQARHADKELLIESLLQDFWEQLGDALTAYYQNANPPPELQTVEKAVLRIERFLKIPRGHMVGGGTMSKVRRAPEPRTGEDAPPAPTSKIEAEQYRALLGKLDGDYRVAEGMIANEARRHPGLDRVQLIERIVARFERHGR